MHPLGLRHPPGRAQKYFRECAGPVEAVFPVMPVPGLGFWLPIDGGIPRIQAEMYAKNVEEQAKSR